IPHPIQFGHIRRQVDHLFSPREADALFAREADEFDPPIALLVGLAARHRARQPLFAVKAVARAENNVLSLAAVERGPEGLLNRLAAAGGPQDLFAAGATGLLLQ